MDLIQKFSEDSDSNQELFQMTFKFASKMYELDEDTSEDMFDKMSMCDKIIDGSTFVVGTDYFGMRTSDDQFFKLYYFFDEDEGVIFSDLYDIDVDEYLDIINEKKHI